MPMIDVYAPDSLFPVHSAPALISQLIHAVLRAEGVASPGPFHLNNTAVFLHRMPRGMEGTAGDEHAWKVRVQILTPPGALTSAGQIQLVKEVTEIVERVSGDSSQSKTHLGLADGGRRRRLGDCGHRLWKRKSSLYWRERHKRRRRRRSWDAVREGSTGFIRRSTFS